MDIRIDRAIPVPITAQIKGQIEYGVTYGTIERGSRLPNVRDLARDLQVSPVTVSQAYQALRDQGLVTSAPGRGTFVSESLPTKVETADRYATLDAGVRDVVSQARSLGVSLQELVHLVGLRMADGVLPEPLRFAFIGIYRGPSEHYVRGIERYLDASDRVEVLTFDELDATSRGTEILASFDALLTFGHRMTDVERIAPAGTPILAVPVIPAEETRMALAAVDPLARVGLVAAFPEFLAVLHKGVATFAPHLPVDHLALAGEDDIDALARDCDVVVFASGSQLGAVLPTSGVRLIEYLHTPDPAFLVRTLAPRIAELRARTTHAPAATERGADEARSVTSGANGARGLTSGTSDDRTES